MAQESNLGRNALAKTLQLEGIKVSSGSISKILKESKESKSKSNNNSIIDITAATTEQTKSVDEITQSGQSQPLLEFHRGLPSDASKSVDTSGSPTSKCESSFNGVGLADAINQQTQQEIAPELEEIDFADEPFDSDVSTDSINNDFIENEVSTEESEQEDWDSKLADTKAEISNQVNQPPILTIPGAIMRDHSSLPVHEPLSTAVKSGPSGCPLSRFIPQEEIPDLEDSKVKKAYDQPTIKNMNDLCMEDIDILDADSEPDIYTDPNADYGIKGEHRLNYQYTNTMNRTFPNTMIPFPNNFNPYPNIFNQQVSRHVIEETKKQESDQTSKNMLGIDWDDDENHQARFVKWVLNQKKIRQQEERKLEEGWRLLVNERNSLEEQKRNLEAREAKLHEVKDLIPSAKVLKEIGFDFSQANSWLEAIKGKAEQEGLDLRTAAWGLVEDLRNWREVGGLRKAIARQKQQLDLLCLATDQQKEAIGIIVDLKKSGMTDEDISNLVKVVSKWSSKVGQGNVSSFELDSRLNLQNTPQ
jgi:hypothetical protein